jgi:hypothetical protein
MGSPDESESVQMSCWSALHCPATTSAQDELFLI